MFEFLQVAAPCMIFMGLIFVYLSNTKWGNTKAFHLFVGIFAIATAVVYGFLTVTETSWFSPIGMIGWFIVGFIKFSQAVSLPIK